MSIRCRSGKQNTILYVVDRIIVNNKTRTGIIPNVNRTEILIRFSEMRKVGYNVLFYRQVGVVSGRSVSRSTEISSTIKIDAIGIILSTGQQTCTSTVYGDITNGTAIGTSNTHSSVDQTGEHVILYSRRNQLGQIKPLITREVIICNGEISTLVTVRNGSTCHTGTVCSAHFKTVVRNIVVGVTVPVELGRHHHTTRRSIKCSEIKQISVDDHI